MELTFGQNRLLKNMQLLHFLVISPPGHRKKRIIIKFLSKVKVPRSSGYPDSRRFVFSAGFDFPVHSSRVARTEPHGGLGDAADTKGGPAGNFIRPSLTKGARSLPHTLAKQLGR